MTAGLSVRSARDDYICAAARTTNTQPLISTEAPGSTTSAGRFTVFLKTQFTAEGGRAGGWVGFLMGS